MCAESIDLKCGFVGVGQTPVYRVPFAIQVYVHRAYRAICRFYKRFCSSGCFAGAMPNSLFVIRIPI